LNERPYKSPHVDAFSVFTYLYIVWFFYPHLLTYYKWLYEENFGNPYVGRELRALLRETGFINIKASASYQCYEPLSAIAEYLALRIEDSAKEDQAVEKGWTDEMSLTAMSNGLREWSQHPDGFFAQAWCEVVGQKG
ncbi:MAG: hypothetical protein V7L22_34160, partial [Nostoc sp.]|uniref:hypothetical protein n=1 Tax=Nostoc sp. TaxID=1180 RepID=UPI002FF65491